LCSIILYFRGIALIPERRPRAHQKIVALTPEIIRDQTIVQSQKVRELLIFFPLRPIRQARSPRVRIEGIDEADIIRLDGETWHIWRSAIGLQDVRSVESAQERNSIVIGCQVGPGWYGRVNVGAGVEEDPTGEGESEVSKKCG